MAIKAIMEPGDTIYFPHLMNPDGRPMIVKDYCLGMGAKGYWVQYLSDDTLDALVEEMHKNIQNEYDNLIVITGAEGSGKSNLAYWVAKKFDPEFQIEDGYIYDIGPWLQKLDGGDIKGKVFWMDEATNLVSARNWMKDENKSLIQLLEMMRSKGMTLIMCIPLLSRIDVYIRDTRMRYHLRTAERKWDINSEVKRGYFELQSKKIGMHTVCWGTFEKIPEEEKNTYETLKHNAQMAKVHEIRQKYEEENNPETGPRMRRSAEINGKLLWAMCIDRGMSYSEVSELTGIEQNNLRRILSDERKRRSREGED